MAWNIRRDADLLRTEAEVRAEAIGNVWIEKLEIDCRRPVAGAAESADPIDALRRTMNDEIVGSEAFRAEANDIVNDLLAQLPPECRRSLAPDDTGLEPARRATRRRGIGRGAGATRRRQRGWSTLMRIRKLGLRRYGKFTDAFIDFGERVRR